MATYCITSALITLSPCRRCFWQEIRQYECGMAANDMTGTHSFIKNYHTLTYIESNEKKDAMLM